VSCDPLFNRRHSVGGGSGKVGLGREIKYRMAQKVLHFSTHHIFVTIQDKMKQISPVFVEFLGIKLLHLIVCLAHSHRPELI